MAEGFEWLAHAGEATAVFGAGDRKRIAANDAWDSLYARPSEAKVGTQLFAPVEESVGFLAHEIARRLSVEKFWRQTVLCRKADDSEFWARVTVSARTHEAYGDLWVIVVCDLSEERAERALIERKLAAAQERADSLAHALKLSDQTVIELAHEVRTPIAVLSGFLEVLRSIPPPEAARVTTILERMSVSVSELSLLVSRLVYSTALDSGIIKLTPTRLPLADEARAVLSANAALLRGHEVNLTVEPPGLVVWADAGALARSWQVLLSNAGRFSAPGSVIDFTAQDLGDGWAKLEVVDITAGAPPKDLEAIFDGVRIDATGPSGPGFGLGMVRRLMELTGGRYGAESRPGRGMAVWFTLPVARDRNVQPDD